MGEVGEVHALQSPNAAMSRSALVEERKHFLAQAFGVFIALLGLAMLGVLLGNVLRNGTAGVLRWGVNRTAKASISLRRFDHVVDIQELDGCSPPNALHLDDRFGETGRALCWHTN